jgi:tetratricopeptide (TPR) repeat protein
VTALHAAAVAGTGAKAALAALTGSAAVRQGPGGARFWHRKAVDEAAAFAVTSLSRLHDRAPEREGFPREEVAALFRSTPDPALLSLALDGNPAVARQGELYLLPARKPKAVELGTPLARKVYRLVRVRAAAALAGVPPGRLGGVDRQSLESARKEAETSFQTRPDDHASHYNLGNLYLAEGNPRKAIDEYGISSRLRPDSVPPLVNASMAYYALGEKENAEKSLRRAVKIAPENVAARLNLGMLLGEMGKEKDAEKEFRAAAKTDPKSAQAAYNLCVVTSKDRVDEALKWCRKATNLRPEEPRYGYTYAFILDRKGDTAKAIPVLRKIVERNQPYPPAYVMLGAIYEKQGKAGEAKKVYKKAADNAELPEPDRAQFRNKLQSMGK